MKSNPLKIGLYLSPGILFRGAGLLSLSREVAHLKGEITQTINVSYRSASRNINKNDPPPPLVFCRHRNQDRIEAFMGTGRSVTREDKT